MLNETYLERLRKLSEAATAGPWHSMRDGNQFVNTSYIPTAKLVGASRIEEIKRPWNPHAYTQFGFKATMHEVARFLDEDADFIAESRTAIPRLLDMLEKLGRWPALEGKLQTALDAAREEGRQEGLTEAKALYLKHAPKP